MFLGWPVNHCPKLPLIFHKHKRYANNSNHLELEQELDLAMPNP